MGSSHDLISFLLILVMYRRPLSIPFSQLSPLSPTPSTVVSHFNRPGTLSTNTKDAFAPKSDKESVRIVKKCRRRQIGANHSLHFIQVVIGMISFLVALTLAAAVQADNSLTRIPCRANIDYYCSGGMMPARVAFPDPLNSSRILSDVVSVPCSWSSEGFVLTRSGIFPQAVSCSRLASRALSTCPGGFTYPIFNDAEKAEIASAANCTIMYLTTVNAYSMSSWGAPDRVAVNVSGFYDLVYMSLQMHSWFSDFPEIIGQRNTTCLLNATSGHVVDTFVDEFGPGCSFQSSSDCRARADRPLPLDCQPGCNLTALGDDFDICTLSAMCPNSLPAPTRPADVTWVDCRARLASLYLYDWNGAIVEARYQRPGASGPQLSSMVMPSARSGGTDDGYLLHTQGLLPRQVNCPALADRLLMAQPGSPNNYPLVTQAVRLAVSQAETCVLLHVTADDPNGGSAQAARLVASVSALEGLLYATVPRTALLEFGGVWDWHQTQCLISRTTGRLMAVPHLKVVDPSRSYVCSAACNLTGLGAVGRIECGSPVVCSVPRITECIQDCPSYLSGAFSGRLSSMPGPDLFVDGFPVTVLTPSSTERLEWTLPEFITEDGPGVNHTIEVVNPNGQAATFSFRSEEGRPIRGLFNATFPKRAQVGLPFNVTLEARDCWNKSPACSAAGARRWVTIKWNQIPLVPVDDAAVAIPTTESGAELRWTCPEATEETRGRFVAVLVPHRKGTVRVEASVPHFVFQADILVSGLCRTGEGAMCELGCALVSIPRFS
ncbi:hypothetical protein PAPYR_8934 [Paratrimastix pyriformis]|uniref:Uncharacterized protein n=1 Tax=Paratrimastix pyriformis TaxID=342808 RepID=A0ABQ8UE79_9EUKA|nr:hypothetical protein PAPYR_8934 [Paratrimastix pyriformis]